MNLTNISQRLVEFVMATIILLVVLIPVAFILQQTTDYTPAVSVEYDYPLNEEQKTTFLNGLDLKEQDQLSVKALTLKAKFLDFKGFSLFVLMVVLASVGIVFFGLWHLRKFLINSKNSVVFTLENAHRLRSMGMAVLVFFFMHGVLFKSIQASMAGVLNETNHFFIDFDFEFPLLILALVLLVIAAQWKKGVLLQKEMDLTI